jgi:hypothetical protein
MGAGTGITTARGTPRSSGSMARTGPRAGSPPISRGVWPVSKPFAMCGRMDSCIAPRHCFAGEPRERPAPVPTRNIVTDRLKAIAMGLTEGGEADVEP